MASQVPAAASKAIAAAPHFLKAGAGASAKFNVTQEIIMATITGVGLGLVWKTWHWNEKRKIAQYYYDLADKQVLDEKKWQAEISAKLSQLEEELLS